MNTACCETSTLIHESAGSKEHELKKIAVHKFNVSQKLCSCKQSKVIPVIFFNQALCHEGILGNGSIAPLIL
jgi:hypothetical protein